MLLLDAPEEVLVLLVSPAGAVDVVDVVDFVELELAVELVDAADDVLVVEPVEFVPEELPPPKRPSNKAMILPVGKSVETRRRCWPSTDVA